MPIYICSLMEVPPPIKLEPPFSPDSKRAVAAHEMCDCSFLHAIKVIQNFHFQTFQDGLQKPAELSTGDRGTAGDRVTGGPGDRGTGGPGDRGTGGPGDRGSGEPRDRGTGGPGDRGTEEPGDRGTG